MNKHITFSQLEHVLLELGFRKKIVPQSCVTYEYPTKNSLLVVRLHEPDELVPDYVMVATRGQLDGQGVVAAADFDAMLHAIAA
jgi:hypothetical protein